MDGGLDAELHTSILQGEFLAMMGCYGFNRPKLTFQQDNDPNHTSNKSSTEQGQCLEVACTVT
jgi:hypothetical protein